MLKEFVANGTTIDEAIEKGCAELGASRDDVGVEVLEYPKSKTLGLFGGSPAVVKVYIETDDEPETEKMQKVEKKEEPAPVKEEKKAEKAEEKLEEKPAEEKVEVIDIDISDDEDNAEIAVTDLDGQAKEAYVYLRSILDAMNMQQVEIKVLPSDDAKKGAVLELVGEGLGAIIGRRGEILTALQYLVSLAANNGDDDYFRISLNIGNYKEKREVYLENLAKKTAARALKINKNLALEALNPYERRIVHTAVQKIDGVSSWSVDEGARRHVVIGPIGLAEGEDGLPVNFNRSGKGNYNRSGNRGYNRDRNDRGGYRGGYNRDRNDRGYTRNRNGIRTYNNNYSRPYNNRYSNSGSNQNYNNNSNAAPKRDSSAPLYGRISVPKKDSQDDSE